MDFVKRKKRSPQKSALVQLQILFRSEEENLMPPNTQEVLNSVSCPKDNGFIFEKCPKVTYRRTGLTSLSHLRLRLRQRNLPPEEDYPILKPWLQRSSHLSWWRKEHPFWWFTMVSSGVTGIGITDPESWYREMRAGSGRTVWAWCGI